MNKLRLKCMNVKDPISCNKTHEIESKDTNEEAV